MLRSALPLFAVLLAAPAARAGDSLTAEADDCPREKGRSEEQRFQLARDHYQRGLNLYEQGDYDAAVREFIATYCLRDRYPGYFYDIGQTYERLLEYEKAVAYFERFLREARGLEKERLNLRKAEIRVEVLERLPARITVASEPPGAQVTVRSGGTVAASGAADPEDPLLVTRGAYTMQVEADGYAPVTREIEVEIGQPYSFYFRLEKLRGTLKVNAQPGDARIFVDRRLLDVGSVEKELPVGRYRVAVEAPERPPVRQTVEITAGGTTELDVALPAPPESGRTELIIGSTVWLGLLSTGSVVAITEDATLASIGGLGGLGLGFVGSWFGVPDDVPEAWSSYFIGAATMGATEGFLIGNYACELGGGEDPAPGEPPEPGDCSAPSSFAGVVGSIAGLGVAGLTVKRFDLSAGDVALIHSGAIWGTATGILFAELFDGGGGRVQEPLALAGLNLGIASGAVLVPHLEMSRGRTALIDLGGLSGLVAGVALNEAAGNEIDEQQTHLALVGMASGLITAAYLTRNMDAPGGATSRVKPVIGAVRDAGGERATTLGARLTF